MLINAQPQDGPDKSDPHSEHDGDRKHRPGGGTTLGATPAIDGFAQTPIPPIEMFLARTSRHLFPPMPLAQESEFHRKYNEDSAPVARVGLIIGECLYVAFYFWDRVIDYTHSSNTLTIRLLVAAWFFVVTMLPSSLFRQHLQTLMTPSILAAGVEVVIIISIEFDGLNVGVSGVVLVLMFNFGFFRLLFVPSLISGVIICAAYNVAAVVSGLDTQRIIANNFFLFSAIISGASITYLLERLFRAGFITNTELARERVLLARQLQADSRYLDWLRRLATFLRHEVRQPIAKINSSIEIIALRYQHDCTVLPHIENATLAARDVSISWSAQVVQPMLRPLSGEDSRRLLILPSCSHKSPAITDRRPLVSTFTSTRLLPRSYLLTRVSLDRQSIIYCTMRCRSRTTKA